MATTVGYVQHVDIAALQKWAEHADAHVVIAALPGTFATVERPLAFVRFERTESVAPDHKDIVEAFRIGTERRFDDDPRFGLVVLSEIAGRALSTSVNDPGTAINIVGRLVRLFSLWCEPGTARANNQTLYDRVEVPELSIQDMFDDAFTAIARDGAGHVEVSVRLQKALHALASIGDEDMREAASYHKSLALERSRVALDIAQDLAVVCDAAGCDAEIPRATRLDRV